MCEIADLHIHSHYSRATSKNTTLEWLYFWAKIKGITILGTGDCIHPKWLGEIQEKLEKRDDGFYHLKENIANEIDKTLPASVRSNKIRYVLTVEISNIYKKHERVRKLHNCIVLPSIESAVRMSDQLSVVGNIKADGRPIFGMDSKELLARTISIDKSALFFPAHIWTPWFGMFGSKSGFDSIKEAFEDLAGEIYAIETGLSADPFMNWRIVELQSRTILSNSDAHSPPKLGREATIMDKIDTYTDMIQAIRKNDKRIIGTIEFYPQEGKYHHDGHRLCGVSWSPIETRRHSGICTVCKKQVVIGVDNRVEQLSTPTRSKYNPHHKKVEYIIPLIEIISQVQGGGVGTKKNMGYYHEVIAATCDEFTLLRQFPLDRLAAKGHIQLASAINAMRKGDVDVYPGYDGEYGTIRVKSANSESKQATLW